MKAISYEDHGSVEQLKLVDIEPPELEKGGILIKVKAVALNGFDPMILNKIPGINTPLPMVPGGDISGVVEAIDVAAETDLKVGDRVLVDPLLPGRGVLGETVRGGACEFVSIPARNVLRISDNVSFVDAAALPIAYGTAHRLMMTRAGVKKGDKVLVLGATGGVGVCCIQLAKMVGAEVAACTTSGPKAELLEKLGVDHVINTTEADYVDAVKAIWGKPRVMGPSGGADIVVNYVGGDDWAKALRCVTREGKMLTCGATNGFDPKTDIRFIWSFQLSVMGSNGWERSDLEQLIELVGEGKIEPVKHSVRPLQELSASLQEMIDRKVFGKCVLTV